MCPASLELSRGAGRLSGTVLATAGGTYQVHIGQEVLECSLRGRVKHQGAMKLAVGDRVEVERLPDGTGRITAVHPRTSALTRRSLARRSVQVIAANVDQIAVVVSAVQPEPDRRMLDRLLAVAELSDLDALVVVNKIDLVPGSCLPVDLATYPRLGYRVLPTSAKLHSGLEALRDSLSGNVTVLSGSSGVGKSSLVNALIPGLELRVGEVRERSGRGRHTTVGARLIPLPAGGFLADTPGIQHFQPGSIEPGELSRAFREMAPLLESCRFADCRHRSEPGCEVRAAVAEGRVDDSRFESYLELLGIAEQDREEGSGQSGR